MEKNGFQKNDGKIMENHGVFHHFFGIHFFQFFSGGVYLFFFFRVNLLLVNRCFFPGRRGWNPAFRVDFIFLE
jgi:hypothetical protein